MAVPTLETTFVGIPTVFGAAAMLTYDSAAFPLFFQIGHTGFLICKITHEIQKIHNGGFYVL
ncbi:hypothetical protein BACCOPRO_00795 [Phocaeicola coprophilus DSM 18228 = JCM 13818]|uniref:Uncharacterized protein n=1 Tax=Phocaeicola coprophilus DSM 18228 = JCM 13818 TaxID=547042 RepID=S0F6N8_9BACT|nr:hypothetical protein BACCOPRO_00795 [Phocaeicola coprophilus DSM 18228 = JCM 13818]